MRFQIGSPNWRAELINATQFLGDGFWTHFNPISKDEVAKLELRISRKLPDEFKEFYHRIGYGRFMPGDGFYFDNVRLA